MMRKMHYQLELAGGSATLYVAGGLDHQSVATLLEVCHRLPAHVRTLRLDLQALGTMTADATSAVRVLVRQWRDDRRGEFRLSTSYLFATCSEVEAPRPPDRLLPVGTAVDAPTATYL
jgi:ABC-type transporter Mla MlaB component